jgi:hypothetical protein
VKKWGGGCNWVGHNSWIHQEYSDRTICGQAVWICGVRYGHCMRVLPLLFASFSSLCCDLIPCMPCALVQTCVGRAYNYTIKQCKGVCRAMHRRLLSAGT